MIPFRRDSRQPVVKPMQFEVEFLELNELTQFSAHGFPPVGFMRKSTPSTEDSQDDATKGRGEAATRGRGEGWTRRRIAQLSPRPRVAFPAPSASAKMQRGDAR